METDLDRPRTGTGSRRRPAAVSSVLFRGGGKHERVTELLTSEPTKPYDVNVLYTVAAWCLALLGDAYEDNPFDTALLSAMSVLAVRPDGGFHMPQNYTRLPLC